MEKEKEQSMKEFLKEGLGEKYSKNVTYILMTYRITDVSAKRLIEDFNLQGKSAKEILEFIRDNGYEIAKYGDDRTKTMRDKARPSMDASQYELFK